MIDIHSHILPGLDDGSSDPDQSLAMIRLAAESGTTDIVATPHSDLQFPFDPAVTESAIAALTQASGGAIRIHYGCDFHLHYENVQDALANPAKYAVNHKNYLLVELSELLTLKTADEILGRLAAARITPILTHPERNSMLQQQSTQLASWAASGYCLQITAQSLLGDFGRRARAASQELLDKGLVHFVASDGHDCSSRPPRLDLAFEWVQKEYGAETAQRLFRHNPAAVLRGEPLPDFDPQPPARKKWWRLGS